MKRYEFVLVTKGGKRYPGVVSYGCKTRADARASLRRHWNAMWDAGPNRVASLEFVSAEEDVSMTIDLATMLKRRKAPLPWVRKWQP